jgi:putative Holliday junction resolvase
VAVSDATATLARPHGCLMGPDRVAEAVALVRQVQDDEADVVIVVGLPRRLDGGETDATPRVRAFARALERQLGLVVVFQDERLSSVEAESRLALRERDWRKRKARIDAAAAAVILQDYLDEAARRRAEPHATDAAIAADAHD